MTSNVWQLPFVDVFSQFGGTKKGNQCSKKGSVDRIMDKTMNTYITKLTGAVPASNYIQFPKSPSQSLGLIGRFMYIQYKTSQKKPFMMHIEVVERGGMVLRLSFSNIYKEFKATSTWLQFPMVDQSPKWTLFVLDIVMILAIYLNKKFVCVKSIQLCASMNVRGIFTTDKVYSEHKLPPGMKMFVPKDKHWRDLYSITLFPVKEFGASIIPHFKPHPIIEEETENYRTKQPQAQLHGHHKRGTAVTRHYTPNSIKETGTGIISTFPAVGLDIPILNPLSAVAKLQQEENVLRAHLTGDKAFLADAINQQQQLSQSTSIDSAISNMKMKKDVKQGQLRSERILNSKFSNQPSFIPHLKSYVQSSNYPLIFEEATSLHRHQEQPEQQSKQSRFIGERIVVSPKLDKQQDATNCNTIVKKPFIELVSCGDILLSPKLSSYWLPHSRILFASKHRLVVRNIVDGSQVISPLPQRFHHIVRFCAVPSQHLALSISTPSYANSKKSTGNSVKFILTTWSISDSAISPIATKVFSQYVSAISLSSCGQYAAVAHSPPYQKATVIILSLEQQRISTFHSTTLDGDIAYISFYPNDPSRFLSCGRNNIKMWRVKDGEFRCCPVDLQQHHNLNLTFNKITFHAHDNVLRAFVCASKGRVFVVRCRVMALEYVATPHPTEADVLSLSVSGSGDHAIFFTGDSNGLLRVWKHSNFQSPIIEVQHSASLYSLSGDNTASEPDANNEGQTRALHRCVCIAADGTMGVFNSDEKQYRVLSRVHTQLVINVAVCSALVATCARDGTVRVWQQNNLDVVEEIRADGDMPTSSVFHPSGTTLFIGYSSGTVRVFNLNRKAITKVINECNASITHLFTAKDGNILYVLTSKGQLTMFATDKWHVLRVVEFVHKDTFTLRKLHKQTKKSNAQPKDDSEQIESLQMTMDYHRAFIIISSPTPGELTILNATDFSVISRMNVNLNYESSIHKKKQKSLSISSIATNRTGSLIWAGTRNGVFVEITSRFGKIVSHRTVRDAIVELVWIQAQNLLLVSHGQYASIWGTDPLSHQPLHRVDFGFFAKGLNYFLSSNTLFTGGSGGLCLWKLGNIEEGRSIELLSRERSDSTSSNKTITLETSDLLHSRVEVNHSNGSMSDNKTESTDDDVDSYALASEACADSLDEDQDHEERLSSKLDIKCSISETDMNLESIENKKIVCCNGSEGEEEDVLEQAIIDEMERRVPPSLPTHVTHHHTWSPLPALVYAPDPSQAGITLSTTIGFNAIGSSCVLWHSTSGRLYFACGTSVVIEDVETKAQQHLLGHKLDVSTLALSKDGSLVASASERYEASERAEIRVWTALSSANGNDKPISLGYTHKCTLRYHLGDVTSMSFSRDDRLLLSLGNYQDPSLCLWDVNVGHLLACSQLDVPCHSLSWDTQVYNEFSCVGEDDSIFFFFFDDSKDALRGDECALNVFRTGIQRSQPQDSVPHKQACTTVAHSDMGYMFVGHDHGRVSAWATTSNVCVSLWEVSNIAITAINVCSSMLMVSDAQGKVSLFSFESNTTDKATPNGKKRKDAGTSPLVLVEEAVLNVGACILASSVDDVLGMAIVATIEGACFVLQWGQKPQCIRLFSAHTKQIRDLCVSASSLRLCSCGDDGSVRVWDTEQQEQIMQFQLPHSKQRPALSVGFSPDATRVVCGYGDGVLRVFDVEAIELIAKFMPHKNPVTAVTYSLDGRVIISGNSKGTISISSASTGMTLRTIIDHEGAPIDMFDITQGVHEISKHPEAWLACSRDGRISVWHAHWVQDKNTLQEWIPLPSPSFKKTKALQEKPPTLATFSPIDPFIVIFSSYSKKPQINFYSLSMRKVIKTINVHQHVFSLRMSPRGKLLAIGTHDRLLRIMDYNKGTFQDFRGHSDSVRKAIFAADGTMLFTSARTDIIVWNPHM
eukprot:m.95575 g.95575  ORF g.95575 m.95575 type:complete len:1922 (-) comp8952_c0_seq2:138-5903(-)